MWNLSHTPVQESGAIHVQVTSSIRLWLSGMPWNTCQKDYNFEDEFDINDRGRTQHYLKSKVGLDILNKQT